MERFSEEQLKAHLVLTNDEYRHLHEEHHILDEKLVALEAKDRLTYDEQMEEVRLKKMKLHAKDRMQQILSEQLAHA